ncbi:hypothetical protein D3C84_637290 [compost metagenome]
MKVHQRQVRVHAFSQQGVALLAVARRPYLTAPTAEQAVHADQNAVLVVDAQHLHARQGLAVVFLCRDGDRLGCAGQRHADAEHAALARP